MADTEKPDLKQAQAFVRVARRDMTALAGMFDSAVLQMKFSASMPSKPLRRA